MGDCLPVGILLSYYVTSHPGQLSLAIPPWGGAVSTGDGYGYRWGRKRRVLRSSNPCDQDCWYIDLLVKGVGCQIEPAIRPIWVIYWLNWV